MKKLLLTTAAAAVISTSAFADMGTDQFYLRADVMGAKFNKVTAFSKEHKTKYDYGMDFGVGYGLMDNMRTELVYNHVFNPKFKDESKSTVKPSAHAVMLRGLVDFADLGVGKLHAGLGLGWAQTGSKYDVISGTKASSKAKKKNNLAWSAHFGAGFDAADGVKVDVTYSYRDYGKSKELPALKTGGAKGGASTVRSHNLGLGVRFDI